QNLYSLYDYMITRLLDANVQNSLQILDEVISLLLPIKKAWASIPEDAKEEAYEIQRRKSHSM
ncbi:MAG: flagellar protein FliS, partial [Glaciecola sp.]